MLSCLPKQNGKSSQRAEKDKITSPGEKTLEMSILTYIIQINLLFKIWYEGLVRYVETMGKFRACLSRAGRLVTMENSYLQLEKSQILRWLWISTQLMWSGISIRFFKRKTKKTMNGLISPILIVTKLSWWSYFEITLKEPYSATLYDLSMIFVHLFLSRCQLPDGDDTP